MTAALPTPADVAPAHVVRVRMTSGRVYTSPIRTPQETAEAANEMQKSVEIVATGTGFVYFRTDTVDGPVVRLRADRVEAIETSRPPAHRSRPTPAPIVHVHLHTTDAPEGAEPYLGLSTERVLELIRAEQRGSLDPRAESQPPRCQRCGMPHPTRSTAEFFEARDRGVLDRDQASASLRAEQRWVDLYGRPAATLQQEDALPDEVAGGAL